MCKSQISEKVDEKTISKRKKDWELYKENTPIKMDPGFNLLLRPKCEYSYKRFVYRKAEVEDLDFLINKLRLGSQIILDVGANIGYWSKYLTWYKKNVISFEPDPITFNILKNNLIDYKNYSKVENLAIGDEKGNIDFFLNPLHSGDSSLTKGADDWDKISVPVCDLDSYLSDHQIDNIGLIKVDIQGGELNCLKGAEKIISKMLPIIICELSNFSDHRKVLKSELTLYLEKYLIKDLGYKPYQISNSGISLIDNIETISSSNVWFIHDNNSFYAFHQE